MGFSALSTGDGGGTVDDVTSIDGAVDDSLLALQDATSDGPPAVIAWRKAAVARSQGNSFTTDTFTIQAAAAGDTIVFQTVCRRGTQPTLVVTPPTGWVFAPLDPVSGSAALQWWSATFTAVAPDQNPGQVTVTWSQACTAGATLGDEFSNVDPTGGAVSFGAHSQTTFNGNCVGAITTQHPSEAVWAACTTSLLSTGISPGYTQGANSGTGDITAYKVTSSPAGTMENVTLSVTNGATSVLSMTTLKPR